MGDEPLKLGDLVITIGCGYKFGGRCCICDHSGCWVKSSRKIITYAGDRPVFEVTAIDRYSVYVDDGKSFSADFVERYKEPSSVSTDPSVNPWNM